MTDHFAILQDLLGTRHSCRAFQPDPVPETTIRQIIEAAARAPSWCNAQPWQVTVTHGTETDRFRETLRHAVQNDTPKPDLPWPQSYPGAHGTRRLDCGLQLYEAVGIPRSDRAGRARQSLENYRLFGAPHVAIVHSEAELGPYGAMDTGGFVTAFTLAATALGVGTIAQASVAAYAPMIRSHFNLPESRLILCAISFGLADEDHPANSFRTSRAKLSEIYDPRG
ncbi:MAG: nitroreductase [Rhodobacteraceae bacterium CG17_big_fil_post_rev_8_21_14_2_50_63_15]|nr:nitroreductase [Roseovarius sp.]PIV78844.1 MAG: nitroreductase [Rhodobacteraceae bacterium CG17_big_fil_post_rev_8_21_14_2_50_63_15]